MTIDSTVLLSVTLVLAGVYITYLQWRLAVMRRWVDQAVRLLQGVLISMHLQEEEEDET